MCQAEVQPDSSLPEALTIVNHNARTLWEQLDNAAKVARARRDRVVARDLELMGQTVDEVVVRLGGLFSIEAKFQATKKDGS
jgi:hypothetical protein